MAEPSWGTLLRIAGPIRIGFAVILGVLAAVGAVTVFGAGTGLGTVVGLVVLVAVSYVIGRHIQGEERAELEDDAFEWMGPVSDSRDIVERFYVRQWRPDVSTELPEFVKRDAVQEVIDGLASERFVILKGPRFSGRSRIVYEAMLKMERMVIIAKRSGSDAANDPLFKLMKDPRGFASSPQRWVLVLRDCQERLLAGSIGGEFIRTWLDAHPNVSVLASLSSADLARIDAASSGAGEDLGELEKQAAVVTVAGTLNDDELKEARATFPELNDDRLRHLPAYLCSGETLKERFIEAPDGEHELGQAIVRAAADWERAGIARPAPRRFLEDACGRYVENRGGDFEAELSWALERVDGAAALVYEVEGGFVVDGTARDMLDSGEVAPKLGRELPDFAWEAVRAELMQVVAAGPAEGDLIDDLVGLERGATERGREEIANWAYELALKQDVGPRRINQHLVATSGSGPPPSIMRARDGDNVGRRVAAIGHMVVARARAKRRRSSSSPVIGTRLLVGIYALEAVRAVIRSVALALADALSVTFGLTIGLLVWTGLSDAQTAEVPEILSNTIVPAVSGMLVVFIVLSLYKQDAPKAHLSRILSATLMLAVVALVSSLVQDFDLPAAFLAALSGFAVTAWADYQIRYIYDDETRDWVERNELGVWLLVIGNAAEFKAARAAMDDTTRPTEVIGYLTTDPADVDKDKCLGVVKNLPKVLSQHAIERVLIVDPKMPPDERQDLADKCHTRGLPVEAVPSLEDVQMGNGEFVAGNSLVLMALHPLWQRNLGFFVKRTFDVVVAAIGLVALSPLFAGIAVAIKVRDKHSPWTKEWRVGLAGNVFGMHRFRTTDEDPEALDPRTINTDLLTEGTTGVGKFLCEHRWDELPQLINVLRGEMSLTGPRPLYIKDHLKLEQSHLRRYVVRPGMTGPWQVCERSELSAAELARLDVAYLRNWSFITDLDLIVKALRIGIRGSKSFRQIS